MFLKMIIHISIRLKQTHYQEVQDLEISREFPNMRKATCSQKVTFNYFGGHSLNGASDRVEEKELKNRFERVRK